MGDKNNNKIVKPLRYYFNPVTSCNMCGSKTDTHKILGKRLNRSQGISPKSKTGITTTVVKCSDCGLIYANPQPVPFDIQDHYGVLPEEYWKDYYFETNENYFQGEISRLRTLMDIKAGMKSLDIGAGLGKAMTALQKAGFESYGFEPSQPFYERAITKMGISPERLKLGQMEDIAYAPDTFDFISFGAVLEHLYDPSGSILKAFTWLKPGGIIHIEVPSSKWLINKLINSYYWFSRSGYVANISPMHEPYHLFEFGLKSFTEHAKKHDYEVAFHQYYVCHTLMPKAADYVLKPLMKWTDTGMQLCVWLRKKD